VGQRLFVAITQNDDDFQKIISVMSTAGDVICKRLWSKPDLGSYSGGNEHPLVLFGHANTTNFIRDMKVRDAVGRYIGGQEIVKQLKSCNLQISSFPFCFLVGCSTAGKTGNTGLFVTVAQLLGIPTVGSTTDVQFSLQDNYYKVTPESGGTWRVYMPGGEDSTYGLVTPRCDPIRTKLEDYLFRAG
jgi:hypothetical protein